MNRTNIPTNEKRKITFKARIDAKKRVQIPSRTETFKPHDKVLVTVEDLPED